MQRLNRTLHLILLVIFALSLSSCARENFTSVLKHFKQNVFAYLNIKTQSQPLLSKQQQAKFTQEYIQHYLSPWTEKHLFFTESQVVDFEHQVANQFLLHPGWGENHLPETKEQILDIINRMDLKIIPSDHRKAITIKTANLRVIPTSSPIFADIHKPGDGFPFDMAQESLVAANTPILILQSSRDDAWKLVVTSNDFGWIKTQNIAYVNAAFIKAWQHQHYVAITHDHTPIHDKKTNDYRFDGRLGSIFPLVKTMRKSYLIDIAVRNANEQAVIRHAVVLKQDATKMPLTITPKNIALIANSLLKEPYGWGGMYDYRDCSSTVMDIMTPFGIWLPRNSTDQIHFGDFTSLKNMDNQEKIATIKNQGVPLLTLIHMPGHIMLYIGMHKDIPYVYQDVWGIHTWHLLGPPGRAILGQTVITPITIGKGYINTSGSFLTKVDGMMVIARKK